MRKQILLGSVNLSWVKDSFEWYSVVTTYNMEEKYIENVMNAVSGTFLEDLVAEYYAPVKYVLENPERISTGERKIIKKVKGCYSTYVFIRCKMEEHLWNLLRTTSGASVIPTAGGIPITVSEEDIARIKEIQAPEGFGLQDATDFLMKQYKKYTKIIYGPNGEEIKYPEPDEKKIYEWYTNVVRKRETNQLGTVSDRAKSGKFNKPA